MREAADDGVRAAEAIYTLIGKDRARLLKHATATVHAVRLLDLLPSNPVVTLPLTVELLKVSKPTASKAIVALEKAGILKETTGNRRDRVYAYQKYLDTLTGT